MVTKKEAIHLAQNYFSKRGNFELAGAMECKNYWIFFGGGQNLEIGRPSIKIAKNDGELSDFFMPSQESFELLENAKPLDLSGEFNS